MINNSNYGSLNEIKILQFALIALLLFFIFFSSILSSLVSILLIVSVFVGLFFSKGKIYLLSRRNYFLIFYYLLIAFLLIHFKVAYFKNFDFIIGTILVLFIGSFLCFLNNYKIIKNTILIFGITHLLFLIFSYLSFDSVMLFIKTIAPSDRIALNYDFYQQGRYMGLNTQTSPIAFYLAVLNGIIFINFLKTSKTKFLLFCLFVVLAITLTGRRASILFAIISTLFLYSIHHRIFFKFIVATIIVLILLSWVYASIFNVQFTANEFFNYDNINVLTSNRLFLYNLAYGNYINNPIWGTGFKFFFTEYGQDVHNTYLQFLSEGGILGLFFFLSFIFINLTKTVLNFRKTNQDETLLFSLLIQILYILYSFVENTFSDKYYLLLYVIGVSFNYKYERETNGSF
jgi:O-antigen ligase